MVVGGGAAGVAEAVDFGDDASDGFLKLVAALVVFDDGVGAGEAG